MRAFARGGRVANLQNRWRKPVLCAAAKRATGKMGGLTPEKSQRKEKRARGFLKILPARGLFCQKIKNPVQRARTQRIMAMNKRKLNFRIKNLRPGGNSGEPRHCPDVP